MKNARILYDRSCVNSDLLYSCHFKAADPFCYFEHGSDRVIAVSKLELGRAQKQARRDVKVVDSGTLGTGAPASVFFALCCQYGVKNVFVPVNFPFGIAEELRALGVNVQLGAEPFMPEREWKTEQEVAMIIEAQRAAECGLKAALELLRNSDIASDGKLMFDNKPLTSEFLRGVIDSAILQAGALAEDTIAAGNLDGADPHNTGSGILYANYPIVMDIFPRSMRTGYWGDLTRTVVKGKAADVVKRAFDAVLEAREASKSLLHSGRTGREMHEFAAGLLRKHGFETGMRDGVCYGFFHGLGHGVGLDIHETPRLSPGNNRPLQGGEVVTIEPGLYDPAWGGMRLEDLMLVGEIASKCLTEAETFLEIS